MDQWHTVVITQLVSLCSCDLFLFHFSQLYDEIGEENFHIVAQDILERTWLKTLMDFPKPYAKHSLDFSHFFSFFHQSTDSKKKTRCNLFNKQTKYKLCKSQIYLYDHYHLISRTKTYAKWSKRPINKHWVSEKKNKFKILMIQVITIEQAPGIVL